MMQTTTANKCAAANRRCVIEFVSQGFCNITGLGARTLPATVAKLGRRANRP